MKFILSFFIFLGMESALLAQSEPVFIYGPGGPYPAIQEAATIFSKKNGVKIKVIKGPAQKWLDSAKKNADMIYSGAEFMMTNFIWATGDLIVDSTVTPLYLRPSGLLVRPGNPKKISKFKDILRPGIGILVVNGAGQVGLWEDMAGKQGDIQTVKAFRKNIAYIAHNSAEAKKVWEEKKNLDVWLIWNIWQVSNPHIADFVPVSKKYVVYRDCSIALTQRGNSRSIVRQFYSFLQSKEAARIFKKWGWLTEKVN